LETLKEKASCTYNVIFGQDSISLSRLGAEVTGVDFSEIAIENARKLTQKTAVDTSFVCCDIYDLPTHLDKTFDLVFTSYGTIGWLPDLDKWAGIISRYLKPSGKFIFVEFHPFVWMFDDDFKEISYKYSSPEAIVEMETGTYADKNANINQECVTWNHGLSDVVNNLISKGLEIRKFNEYDYSPYNCFNKTTEIAPRKFRIAHLDNKIPMVYAIVAQKKT